MLSFLSSFYNTTKLKLLKKVIAFDTMSLINVVKLFLNTIAERSALREHVYPKLREFCRENYGLEFQVIDLYWGVEADEWDSPELQKTRMKLLEDCLKSSAGPCFVVDGLLV
uniref:NACHT and WD repeat domain containing 2 n=1 Tax=Meleagris gallopavo TaxID=9103 RepID=G5E7L4_MELGA